MKISFEVNEIKPLILVNLFSWLEMQHEYLKSMEMRLKID